MDILVLADGTRYEMKDQSSISHIGINITWTQLPDVLAKFTTTNLSHIQVLTNGKVSADYANLALKSMTPPDATGYAFFELVDAQKKTTDELVSALKEAKKNEEKAKKDLEVAETARNRAEADKEMAEKDKAQALSEKEDAEAERDAANEAKNAAVSAKENAEAERDAALTAKSEAENKQKAAEQLAATYEDGYKAAKYLMGEE